MQHIRMSYAVLTILVLSMAGCCSTPAMPNAIAPSGNESTRVPPNVDLTDAALRPHIGERITVSGFWSPLGKESGYVYGMDKSSGSSVYVKATNEQGLPRQTAFENTIKDGAPVEVTGVLRWFESVPVATSSPVQQEAPDHFYFDAADNKLIVR